MNNISDDINKDLKNQPKFTEDIGSKNQEHHTFEQGEQSILKKIQHFLHGNPTICLLYTSPSPRDRQKSRMPSSA